MQLTPTSSRCEFSGFLSGAHLSDSRLHDAHRDDNLSRCAGLHGDGLQPGPRGRRHSALATIRSFRICHFDKGNSAGQLNRRSHAFFSDSDCSGHFEQMQGLRIHFVRELCRGSDCHQRAQRHSTRLSHSAGKLLCISPINQTARLPKLSHFK